MDMKGEGWTLGMSTIETTEFVAFAFGRHTWNCYERQKFWYHDNPTDICFLLRLFIVTNHFILQDQKTYHLSEALCSRWKYSLDGMPVNHSASSTHIYTLIHTNEVANPFVFDR